MAFTAAQAAQKSRCQPRPPPATFTAAQAAQKFAAIHHVVDHQFTAAQAAQKCGYAGNHSPPCRQRRQSGQGWHGHALTAGGDGGGEVVPGGSLAGTAGVDDAGEERQGAGALLAAGAKADSSRHHPVVQDALGGIVGQGQAGVSSRGRTIAVQSLSLSRQNSPSLLDELCGCRSHKARSSASQGPVARPATPPNRFGPPARHESDQRALREVGGRFRWCGWQVASDKPSALRKRGAGQRKRLAWMR